MVVKANRRFKLLAVDDNLNTLEIIKRILGNSGYDVLTCDNMITAIEILENQTIELVITDLKMPRHSGMDLVRYIGENHSGVGIIMVTGYPSIDGAVEAVKKGAEEFLAKPFTDEELLSAVKRVLDRLAIRHKAQPGIELDHPHGIVGRSRPIQNVFKLITKASMVTANVLISGESGTGKELVARAIHYGSSRSTAPFVPVNCTAIPEGLLESELFGHVKGAFTGANVTRTGFFQIADGGTIFLDEIGDASRSLQTKLLRVLQNKEINRVGSNEVINVDTRVVVATHKDLKALVKKDLFREDLFYRLSVFDITIPPLRDRHEDIPLLISHFVTDYCREMGRAPIAFSDRAVEALTKYPWPGNVRELENLIQKLVVILDKDIADIVDLPKSMRFSVSRNKGLDRSLAQVEAEHITNVLAGVKGNKTQAARILGIDRKTLREKIKKLEQTP